jgi:uncharacterized protein YozE (UPF0346 family)
MKKYKIKAGNTNKIENDIIEIIPDIISSDIPYFLEVDNEDSTYFKIITEYISNKEKFDRIKNEYIELHIGNKSGKVYKMQVDKKLSFDKFRNVIKKLIKQEISEYVEKDSRYFNNVKFSTNILKELYVEEE